MKCWINGKNLWFLIGISLIGILVFSSFTLLFTTHQFQFPLTDPMGDHQGGEIIDSENETVSFFDAPAFLDIIQITLNIPTSNTLQITLQVAEFIPLSSQDKFCYDFYFDANGDGRWDTIVFSTHGSYIYDSNPPKPPNTAGVIDMASKLLIGNALLSVSGQTLTITLDHSLVNHSTRLLMVVSHYLPGNSTYDFLSPSDHWLHPDLAGYSVGGLTHFVQP